jgi:alcohol dehydrogenase
MRPAPTFCLAAVFRTANGPLLLERIPLPECRSSEVLVRIRCATICGSDLHSYQGRRHSPTPCILGHEMVGEIIAMGHGGANDHQGNPLQLGDRVTWSMVWSCGECDYCKLGLHPKCERLRKFGHEELAPGISLGGGMADHCLLPAGTSIFKVPDNVADEVACSANCATATVAAIYRNAGELAGQHVVVFGAGMLGMTACAMAAVGGAASVIAIEPDSARRMLVREFGATETFDSALPPADLVSAVKQLTSGHGSDLVIDLSGQPEAMETALCLLRPGGHLILAGAVFPGRPLQWSAEMIVRNLLRITGVYNYSPVDLQVALTFLADQGLRFPFAKLVGATFPLSAVNEAFQYAENECPPRVAVRP